MHIFVRAGLTRKVIFDFYLNTHTKSTGVVSGDQVLFISVIAVDITIFFNPNKRSILKLSSTKLVKQWADLFQLTIKKTE